MISIVMIIFVVFSPKPRLCKYKFLESFFFYYIKVGRLPHTVVNTGGYTSMTVMSTFKIVYDLSNRCLKRGKRVNRYRILFSKRFPGTFFGKMLHTSIIVTVIQDNCSLICAIAQQGVLLPLCHAAIEVCDPLAHLFDWGHGTRCARAAGGAVRRLLQRPRRRGAAAAGQRRGGRPGETERMDAAAHGLL